MRLEARCARRLLGEGTDHRVVAQGSLVHYEILLFNQRKARHCELVSPIEGFGSK